MDLTENYDDGRLRWMVTTDPRAMILSLTTHNSQAELKRSRMNETYAKVRSTATAAMLMAAAKGS